MQSQSPAAPCNWFQDNFRAPESMDPLVVEDELEFFGIDLHQMIADYDEIVATNNPEPPKTLKESINMTVRRNPNALNLVQEFV